jgi:iron complex transport system substrate-binding protein
MRLIGLLLPAVLACLAALAGGSAAAAPPVRIASMNQCTDQLLLLLAPEERIASLSFVSGQRPWLDPAQAARIARLPLNRGAAEEMVRLAPDLIVTSAFADPATLGLLRRLGYRVETFAPETSLEEVRASIRRMGELIGRTQRAQEVLEAFDTRLAALRDGRDRGVIAEIGAGLWVPGSGTLSADVAAAAGYRTLGESLGYSGYRYLSLEEILVIAPDLIALSNAWGDPPALATETLRHPAFRRLAPKRAFLDLPDRLMICGSPALLEAVERLVRARSGSLGDRR